MDFELREDYMSTCKKLSIIFCLLLLAETIGAAVIVNNVSQLFNAVEIANNGGENEILLQDGEYVLSNMLWISADNVIIRSLSGNRDAVIIRGAGGMNGGVSHIFNVPGSEFVVRDMTIGWVANHAIQIHGNNNSSNTIISNLHIVDTFEQMVKISYNPTSPHRSRNGLMENCLLEYSTNVGPQYYIGGIDGHQTTNWTVRGNTFRNIISLSNDLAEHAIHFWSDSHGTIVENNIIINCDRGIGFGMGSRGHQGGIIRNNMIYHDAHHQNTADVGIGLENASEAWVYNNTIHFEQNYPNAIEYRFSGTHSGIIANNLTNKSIASRDGGDAILQTNLTNAQASWFINVGSGNLHLSSPILAVVDQGSLIQGLTGDIDGDARPQGGGIDIGADEYLISPVGSLTITSPNGGEFLEFGSHHSITWVAEGITGTLKITLWNQGISLGQIARDLDPSTQSFSWRVGEHSKGMAPLGGNFTIKIKVQGLLISDISNSSFNIVSPNPLDLLTPNGGEELISGNPYSISWTAEFSTNNLKISLWNHSGKIGNIATGVDPTLGEYSWTVGHYIGGVVSFADNYFIKIKAQGVDISDVSESPFFLIQPPLVITSPNGGENWDLGTIKNITWQAQGITGLVKLTLWQGGTRIGIIVRNIDSSVGIYEWNAGSCQGITASAGSNYQIKIKSQNSQTSDYSDSGFTLVGESPPSRLHPQDFNYLGAFRLPGGISMVKSWNYGGSSMTYYPLGDPTGPDDGHPGSIYATGHAWEHQVSEICIPTPINSVSKNIHDLPIAATLQPFRDILNVSHLEIPRTGLAYLPTQGSQTTDKIYFCWGYHMQEEPPDLTHGWCELNLSNPQIARGWYLTGHPIYVRNMSVNDYMFEIPRQWASANTNSKLLATGRYRDGGWSGQGPSLFAISPWAQGNPPPSGVGLQNIPLLLYTSSYEGETNTMVNYHHSDEWSGGAWITAGNKSAVIFAGTKGYGNCWYGDPNGPCINCDNRGWWSDEFRGEIIFYDPNELAAVANGSMQTYEPQPYASLNIDSFLFHIDSPQQLFHVGAICFDRQRGYLYVFQPFADGEKPIIHVWHIY